MSIHWPIIRRLATHPTRVAIHDDRRAYKGIEILVAAAHVADHINSVCSCDRVGLLLPTSGAFPIAALGAWMTGRTIVPLNYLLKPDELQYVVDDAGLDAIFTVGPMLEYLESSPRVRTMMLIEDIEMKAVPPPIVPACPHAEKTAALVYTSGTSGKPKGVMLSHRALRANVRQGVEHLGLDAKRDVMFGVLPQFHSYGMTQLTLTPLSHGVPVVYTARFMPKQLIERFRETGATVMVGIPSMYNALASLKSGTPEHFATARLIASGSEALPDSVCKKFLERYGKPITEGYGMTEMSPATHCSVPGRCKVHSVGQPMPGVEQRIVDPETERELPTGEPGEIRLRGPNAMSGYLHLPEQTAAAFDAQGYYRTGDQGVIDQDGYLFITGRIKEMMIIGGENVFPREIEEVVNTHPDVHASGVIGRADPVRGEVPVCFVELEECTDSAAFDTQSVIALCREKLAGYKVPKQVVVLDKLPRNPTGKIMRKELPGHLEQGQDGSVEVGT